MIRKETDPQNALRAALRQCRTGIFVLLIFGFVINMLYLVAPLYMLQIFDRVLASQRMETLLLLTLIAAFALMVMGALETVRGRIQNRMGNWLDRSMSGELIGYSIDAALKGFAANAQAVRDLGTIRGFITGGLRAILDVPWSPLFIAALWLLHPWLGAFATGCALFLAMLAVVNELVARKPAQESNAGRVDNENLVEHAIRNADVLRAMGMAKRLVDNWNQQNEQVLEKNLRAGDRNAVLFGFARFVRMLAQVGILGLGAVLVIQAELTAGGMIAGSILLGRALAPIEQMTGAWRGLAAARAARKRLNFLVAGLEGDERVMRLPVPKGSVSCEDIWFAPHGVTEPVLQGINFELEPGEVMALMGPSAAGKSTLCKVLVGSWKPSKGYVRLDGTDLHRWEPDKLGPYIGYLPQDIELFPATVWENIARLAASPIPNAVVSAAKAAGVHEMILSLPEGYDTRIGPGGAFLSGGQRQRVGLARTLYSPFGRHPRLIVLDEPNSNLDAPGDQALITAIETAKEWGSTVILVTHNMRLLRPVDKIMVLNEGRKQAFGSREEVLQTLRPRPVRITPAAKDQPAEVAAGEAETGPSAVLPLEA
jgi:PrtD family type I secretion system ABC transporter